MDKRITSVNGIVLAPNFKQAISQFNTFCKGTLESRHNKDNIWFVKACKASLVPGNFKTIGLGASMQMGNFKHYTAKPFAQMPQEDIDEASFVIANFKFYDSTAKDEAKKSYPALLAWRVSATKEI